jgi:hypothetical protein
VQVNLADEAVLGWIPDWVSSRRALPDRAQPRIGPDLGWTAVPCLVQPDCTIQDISLRYYRGTVASLLRKSLFTPNALVPRGPPHMS